MSILSTAEESGNVIVGEWYERYYQPLYTCALFLLKQREQAQDVVQDAFVKALLTFPGLRPESNIYNWLYRIVTNRALDIIRSSAYKTSCSLDDNHLAPLDIETQTEMRISIARTLAKLTPRQRSILLALLEQGYSRTEVASREGIQASTTDQHLKRARKAFRRYYQEVA